MPRILLVHGAFGQAACWDRVIPGLRAAGHSAEAIDLPGAGEDQTPVAEITLDRYARRVCEALSEGPPAILVGHSMGGMVITQAAARCPDRIERLVYVAAFLPEDGQSLIDITHLPEAAGDRCRRTSSSRGIRRWRHSLPRRSAKRCVTAPTTRRQPGRRRSAARSRSRRSPIRWRSAARTPRRSPRCRAIRDVPSGPGDEAGASAADARGRGL